MSNYLWSCLTFHSLFLSAAPIFDQTIHISDMHVHNTQSSVPYLSNPWHILQSHMLSAVQQSANTFHWKCRINVVKLCFWIQGKYTEIHHKSMTRRTQHGFLTCVHSDRVWWPKCPWSKRGIISEDLKGKRLHRCVTIRHIISTGTHARRFKIDLSRPTLPDGLIIPDIV